MDKKGLPQTCVIDLMLADEDSLFFLTAKGKSLYDRLTAQPFVALSGLKGGNPLSSVAISLRSYVRSIGQDRLEEIFRPGMYSTPSVPLSKGG